MIIRNGTVYDGDGGCYEKDILIKGDIIADIGNIPEDLADVTIDASGLNVTPSFIDAHRHCDLAVFNKSFGDIEIKQGIGSIIGGNCGLSAMPIGDNSDFKKDIFNYLEPCLGVAPKGYYVNNYSEYKNMIRDILPVNLSCFIGLGTVAANFKGYGRRCLSVAEMEKALNFINSSFDEGAAGISSGLMYQPECYFDADTIIKLIEPLKKYGRPFVTHVRGEGDNLVNSVNEVIEIAKKADVSLNISHFKAVGKKNWNSKIYEAIEKVDRARRTQDVTVDFYPYTGGATTITSLFPAAFMCDSLADTLIKLDTIAGKEELKNSIYKEYDNWDNMVTAIGWEKIIISSVLAPEDEKYIGKNFIEATNISGCNDVVDFLCELTVRAYGKVGIIVLSMDLEDIHAIAKLPYSSIISDSLYGETKSPHPRLNGSFSTIINDFVLNKNVISMSEAIKKMTKLPADRYNISKRGQIKIGKKADINIFGKLSKSATFDMPTRISSGFKYVILNGKVVLQDDILLDKKSGKILKIL